MPETKLFDKGGTLERGEAMERLKLARTDLSYLLENYDSIAEGGGGEIMN